MGALLCVPMNGFSLIMTFFKVWWLPKVGFVNLEGNVSSSRPSLIAARFVC